MSSSRRVQRAIATYVLEWPIPKYNFEPKIPYLGLRPAISTHFLPPDGGHGFGTWKHPRSHNLYQNDHIFVSRSSLKVVKSCRNFPPLVASDHLTVKAVFRFAAKLRKKVGDRLEAAVRSKDYEVLRPFTPSFNPVIAARFRESFRAFFHAGTDLPTCERGSTLFCWRVWLHSTDDRRSLLTGTRLSVRSSTRSAIACILL
jgi:hypothetical protein